MHACTVHAVAGCAQWVHIVPFLGGLHLTALTANLPGCHILPSSSLNDPHTDTPTPPTPPHTPTTPPHHPTPYPPHALLLQQELPNFSSLCNEDEDPELPRSRRPLLYRTGSNGSLGGTSDVTGITGMHYAHAINTLHSRWAEAEGEGEGGGALRAARAPAGAAACAPPRAWGGVLRQQSAMSSTTRATRRGSEPIPVGEGADAAPVCFWVLASHPTIARHLCKPPQPPPRALRTETTYRPCRAPGGGVSMNAKLESIASGAVRAADKVGASLIICFTHTGGWFGAQQGQQAQQAVERGGNGEVWPPSSSTSRTQARPGAACPCTCKAARIPRRLAKGAGAAGGAERGWGGVMLAPVVACLTQRAAPAHACWPAVVQHI